MHPDADYFVQLAGNQLWQVTLLMLIVGLSVRLLFRKRAHAGYLLLMLVVVKSITPPVWSSRLGLFSWAERETPVAVSDERQAAGSGLESTRPAPRDDLSSRDAGWLPIPDAVETPDELPADIQPVLESSVNTSSIESDIRSDQELATNGADAGFTEMAGNQPATTLRALPAGRPPVKPAAGIWNIRPGGLLAGVWGLGVLLFAGYVVWKWVRFARALRATRIDPPAWLTELFAGVRARVRIRRSVRLQVTELRSVPAAFGVLRPVVLLPRQLLEELSAEEVELILAHELIHIRRFDTLAGRLQLLAQIVWWFHPLVWWTNREIQRERERCCDEELVAGLGCRPATYARCLLNVLELVHQKRSMPILVGMSPVEVTANRLENIMKRASSFKKRMPRAYWPAAAVLALLILPGAGLVGNLPSAEPPDQSSADGGDARANTDTALPQADDEAAAASDAQVADDAEDGIDSDRGDVPQAPAARRKTGKTGAIRWIDEDAQKVWINLGSAEGLKLKMQFDVYGKHADPTEENSITPIAGVIEVVRILGPHLAEARILSSDKERPLKKGNTVQLHKRPRFALVGLFDLDSDGEGDRRELHNLIASYGGSVDVETDVRGRIRGSGMSEFTKFLIVGDIPASSPQMQKQHKRMTESARELGVQIVTLKQFLQFMAYDPTAKPPRLQSVVTGTQSYDGNKCVEIALGSDDGLKRGHRLSIYRREGKLSEDVKFLGIMEIARVDADSAIGPLIGDGKAKDIRKGDIVTTVELTASGKPAPEKLRYLVITRDGKSHHGTVIEDTPEAIVLRNDLRKIVVIVRENAKAVVTLAGEKPARRPSSARENSGVAAAAADTSTALGVNTRYLVLTTSGKIIQGSLVGNTPTTITLKTDAGVTVLILRKEVEAVRTVGTTQATIGLSPTRNFLDPFVIDRTTSTGSADVKQIEARIAALADEVALLRAQLKGSKGSQSTLQARAKIRVQIQSLGKDADSPDFFWGSIFWIEEPFDHRLVLREIKAAQKGGRQVIRVAFTTDGNRPTTAIEDLIKKLRAAGFDDIEYTVPQKKK